MTVISKLITINHQFCYVTKLQYSSGKHNLQSVLANMPKFVKHTAALRKQRLKMKEKSSRYAPGIISLQVLGSGAAGAPRALYMFTDQSRYLFNCGEGTQRLAHEHKMKLAKLEHIFFTHGSWKNVGGLPGVSLTIQDVGVPEITLHGPQGIDDIFMATRRFIVLKDLNIKMADYTNNDSFEDNVMKVQYVPLELSNLHKSRRSKAVSLDRTSQRREASASSSDTGGSSTTDDEIDYYAHERELALPKEQNGMKKKKKKKKRSSSVQNDNDRSVKRRCMEQVGNVAISYVCRLQDRLGALCLKACVERGVPPGPLLGRLKSGEDITLENGTVVKSSDVTQPGDPGPVFIVIECPDERFLEPLENEKRFEEHQAGADPKDMAYLVIHFTPPHIVHNPRYKKWMDRFPGTTNHIMINEDGTCMGSLAVHKIQYQLNLLDSQIFPLLPELSTSGCLSVPGSATSLTSNSSTSSTSSSSLTSTDSSQGSIIQSRTFTSIQLRPNKIIDCSNRLAVNPREFLKEAMDEEGFAVALKNLKKRINDVQTVETQEYPNIVFLGTGSCIPNKTRNTSGILINISEDHCMLLDCGEGTYGQLVRFYGADHVKKILQSIQAVFISHLHADHHIGLIGLIKERLNATKNNGNRSPLFLIAPKQIMTWLNYYNDHFEQVLQQVELVPNSDLIYSNVRIAGGMNKRLLSSLHMASILTAPVRHCPNAFGVSIQHTSGWKLTYSGDTMPCNTLVELGKNSNVLIHEATMEDDLLTEARRKMHSTTSEAIEIGKQMNAKFTLLTHFSQRYAKLPRMSDNLKEGIGIAFDNMCVRLSDLPKLPLFFPALKLLFSEHVDEVEQKAYKREMKQLRESKNNFSKDPFF